jgi:hypothetical protein
MSRATRIRALKRRLAKHDSAADRLRRNQAQAYLEELWGAPFAEADEGWRGYGDAGPTPGIYTPLSAPLAFLLPRQEGPP